MALDGNSVEENNHLLEMGKQVQSDTHADKQKIPEPEYQLFTVPPLVLKYGSLVVLVAQNASLVLIMSYVRTRPGVMFVSSTAVVMSEVFKMLACLSVIFVNEGFSISKWLHHLYANICMLPMDCLRISVPSIIYVIQNNLLYVALSNLDAAIFQVSYQLKILTTAVMSVLLLKMKLSRMQWLALFILFVGVVLIQLPSGSAVSDIPSSTSQNVTLGMTAIVICCMLSAFAGVYLEKILKGTNPSIWVRNVQLGFLGSIFGLCTVFLSDRKVIKQHGFFYGYDWVVWVVVCLQSFGGLVVAVTVKYADNILKGFATSVAIVISCVASVYFFYFRVTYAFTFGTSLVLVATVMYAKFVPQTTK